MEDKSQYFLALEYHSMLGPLYLTLYPRGGEAVSFMEASDQVLGYP